MISVCDVTDSELYFLFIFSTKCPFTCKPIIPNFCSLSEDLVSYSLGENLQRQKASQAHKEHKLPCVVSWCVLVRLWVAVCHVHVYTTANCVQGHAIQGLLCGHMSGGPSGPTQHAHTCIYTKELRRAKYTCIIYTSFYAVFENACKIQWWTLPSYCHTGNGIKSLQNTKENLLTYSWNVSCWEWWIEMKECQRYRERGCLVWGDGPLHWGWPLPPPSSGLLPLSHRSASASTPGFLSLKHDR